MSDIPTIGTPPRKRRSLRALEAQLQEQKAIEPEDNVEAAYRTFLELMAVAREGAAEQPPGSTAHTAFVRAAAEFASRAELWHPRTWSARHGREDR